MATTGGKDVIFSEKDNIKIDNVDRTKRLSSGKIKESLDKLKVSLGKSISDSPLLGSIRNRPLLQGKSKLSSLLDTYKSSIGSSLSRGTSLDSLISTLGIPKKSLDASVSSKKLSPLPWTTDQSLGAGNRPIVLPDYLLNNELKKKKTSWDQGRITVEQVQETAQIRKEINYAVRHNIYVHSASEVKNMNKKTNEEEEEETNDEPTDIETTTPPPPQFDSSFNFFNHFWDNLIGGRFKAFNLREKTVGSARSDFSFVPDENTSHASPEAKIINPQPIDVPSFESDGFEASHDDNNGDEISIEKMMANAAKKMANEGIVTNTIESFTNNEEMPTNEPNQVREQLNITSVREDMSFKIGEDVIAWQTLQRNKRESHALIGITNSSIILVLEKNGVYKLQAEKQLLSQPTFFTTFTYWNQTQRSINGIVIVSIQHEIVFLRVNEAMTKMETIWMWPTNSVTKYLHHFVIDNSDTLLIMTDLHDGSAANLYRFDMNERVFFLRQSLSLKTRANNMAFIQNGFDTFLCFPQVGHVVIYKHFEHFKYFTQIESKNAEILTAFEMGGYKYLAIGGNQAKILRYHHGEFHAQTILSNSWGNVEYFLPVPARTYRDDLILFIQHRLDYGSHTNAYLEALIWNGQAFFPALEVPCFINEHTSELGLRCMLDEDRESGIIGATMFQRNRTISILVPRREAPSGLFDLEIELLPAVSTINEHLVELLSEVIILLETRDQVLLKAKELIENFPKGPMEEVLIKNQTIDTIYTKDLDLGTLIPTEGIFANDELITKAAVDEFLELLSETETNLKTLEELKRNKRQNKEVIEKLHLKSFNVSELHVQYINDIPIEDFIFVEDGNLKLGTVEISQLIEAKHVERLHVDSNPQLGQELSPETTIITGDLTFDEINGVKWRDFLNQIVFKHLPSTIDDIEVIGVSFFFFFYLSQSLYVLKNDS